MQPHAFSLRQLQYALAVADLRSFRKAAERCRVAQPSLSTQLQALETALGVQLFERDRRGVLVTEAGRALLDRMRTTLRDADELAHAASALRDPFRGTLRIGVIPTISPYLLPRVAPTLHRTYPHLTLLWREDKTAALAAQLHAGELDAALVALEAPLGDVEHAVIARDPFVLVARPDSALGRVARAARPDDLSRDAVLVLDDGHCFADQALAVCQRSDAQTLAFRATSLPTLVQMVAGGSGVTLLPSLAVADEVGRARLTVRRFATPPPARTIALVWRRGAALAAALRALARTLRSAYPEPSQMR